MMRMVIILLLCGGGGLANAQNDDDQNDQSEEQTRRPSWSSGLPEREKPEAMSRPDLSQDFQRDLTIDRSELGLERPQVDLPNPSDEQDSVSQEEPSDSIDSAEESVDDGSEIPETETQVVAEPELEAEPEPEPEIIPEPVMEPATYEWQVVNQADVEFPSRGVRNQINGWVDVEVTLNPQGDVVSVQTVDYSDDAGIYVEAAEESIRKWTFQPPQEQGVNDLVSKVYRIDFVPPEIEQPISNQTTSTSSEQLQVLEETPPENNNQASEESPSENIAVVEETSPEASSGAQNSEYKWQILNQAPLDYPLEAARKRLEGWVDIIVTIDPEGEVVMLEEERYSSRGRVFVEPAKGSLQQWQFEPPKNQGINTNVSRSYRIEFEL